METSESSEIRKDRLLIIDDQAGILEMLKRRFVRLGYEVFTTQKSDEAFQILENNDIDLVLLDYMMPQITGFDLFINFQDAYQVPVIMMTAHSSIQLAVEFMKSGGVDFIEKPIDIDVLNLRISRAIHISRQIQFEKEARIKAEKELQQKHQELLNKTEILKTKNEELDAFTAIVSHDLRAPARNINSFITILKRKIENLDEQTTEIFQFIENSSKQMNAMVSELLNMAKMNEIDKKTQLIETDKLVNEIISSVEKEYPLTKFSTGKLPNIYAESVLIQQVFYNLISNAAKYSQKSDAPAVEINEISEAETEFIFMVKDNGIGFDMQFADRLFQIFVRLHTSDEFSGTGVGLANVKRIIERHDGKVWAESEEQKGASFYFSIPKLN